VLQALWTLIRLGHVDRGSELLDTVAQFWKLTVKDQVEELETLDLSIKGNKWSRVEVFVKPQFVSRTLMECV
jgi:hypothetical protein